MTIVCRWCPTVAYCRDLCRKHYRAERINGCCAICQKPYMNELGGNSPLMCCGMQAPGREIRRTLAKARGGRSGTRNANKGRKSREVELALDANGICAKIRRLVDLGEKLEKLSKQVEDELDAANRELSRG